MGFLNIVKQGALITDTEKLDKLYQKLCDNYKMQPNWPTFNKAKEDFVNIVKTN